MGLHHSASQQGMCSQCIIIVHVCAYSNVAVCIVQEFHSEFNLAVWQSTNRHIYTCICINKYLIIGAMSAYLLNCCTVTLMDYS